MIYNCCICNAAASDPQIALVNSNVRAFAAEIFAVWRCPSCGSIHSRDETDLAPYYAKYPFFKQQLNGLLRAGYRRLTRRLRRAGLSAGHSVIDYGCGSGLLVQYLNEQGFKAVGYDPYSATHGDKSCLERTYDFVIAQDVIEHAADPRAVLATLDGLAAPGGAIAIGTPNASGIDLSQPTQFIHPLHQPYHRHILSIEALRKTGESLLWQLERYYPTPYTNMPVLSLPFLHHYMRQFDGTIDTLFDMPLASAKLWLNPKTYALLVAGYFLCDDADVVAIFRK